MYPAHLLYNEPSTPRSDQCAASDGMRTGGEILADQLVIHGVRHVFCVPGESYIAALDGMYGGPIELTVCRQEGGASMMAEAVGKATGRPGICFVTRGPGATNAAAGLHIARQDSTPMILFVGQIGARHARARGVPGARLPRGVRLDRQMGDRDRRSRPHSGAGLARLLHRDQRPARARWWWRCRRTCWRSASHVADVPAFEPIETSPGAAEIERMRQLLAAAERPIVIAGGSRWSEAASAALMRFAGALRHSGGDLVPPHPCHRSAASELCRRSRQRSQSQAARAREGGRPRPPDRRPARRMADAGLHPARRAGAEADADPCASGHRGARPRLPAAACDPRHADRVCRRARSGRGAERHPLARRDQDRACRLPGVHREADRRAGAGESRRDRRRLARCAAGRCRGHAPAPAIFRSGCSASIAIASTARYTRRPPAPWATACRRPSR